ncbi:MAG TPA: hypothetical protein EYH55_02515, partial [Methanothermococcus okinawensis]|nr:hypothetical protein [Methanothermococcus okinawensis]
MNNKILLVLLLSIFILLPVVSAERIIVVLEDTDQIKKAEDLQTFKTAVLEYQEDILATIKNFEKEGKVRNVEQLWIINAIAMDADPEVIEELKKIKVVKKIVRDYPIELFSDTESYTPSKVDIKSGTPQIVWSVKWIEADKVWQWGINGSGVKVAVVDSGIAPHPDLEGKIIAWKDFVNNISQPYDDNGHGTHVAGTIAGTGKLDYKTGVAPGADLIGVKVFNESGRTDFYILLKGFQWAAENDADIISFSGGALPASGIEDTDYIPPYSTKEYLIEVYSSVFEEAYKPAFILVYVNSSDLKYLNISLIAPNGSVVHGDRMDNLIGNPEIEWCYKYMEKDKPLQSGDWTLKIQSTSG